MDVFSEILRGLVLKGALYFNAEFSAPWGFKHAARARVGPTAGSGRVGGYFNYFLRKDLNHPPTAVGGI